MPGAPCGHGSTVSQWRAVRVLSFSVCFLSLSSAQFFSHIFHFTLLPTNTYLNVLYIHFIVFLNSSVFLFLPNFVHVMPRTFPRSLCFTNLSVLTHNRPASSSNSNYFVKPFQSLSEETNSPLFTILSDFWHSVFSALLHWISFKILGNINSNKLK